MCKFLLILIICSRSERRKCRRVVALCDWKDLTCLGVHWEGATRGCVLLFCEHAKSFELEFMRNLADFSLPTESHLN